MNWTWVLDGFVSLAKLAGLVHTIRFILYTEPKGRATMPRATVDTNKTERFELKTLPGAEGEEGGFVELRVMSYSEFLRRRDLMSKMSFQGKDKDQKATIEASNEVVAQYEFQACIVDHNLEDANGKQLDFRSSRAFKSLDPRVGEEIGTYIDKLNKFDAEGEEELGNFDSTSTE